VARRAGELQISRYQNPGEVREKAPKDFVTEEDLLCEELMVNAIGGRATDLSGEPWNLSSEGLIATNAALHDEVLQTLHST
jgi:fructose-1,6-bisphosphatase/inositol monophosphatase family enzyme